MGCSSCGQSSAATASRSMTNQTNMANKILLRYEGAFSSAIPILSGTYRAGREAAYREIEVDFEHAILLVRRNANARTPDTQNDAGRSGRVFLVVRRADAQALIDTNQIDASSVDEILVLPSAIAGEESSADEPDVDIKPRRSVKSKKSSDE
jgi:hypothetical protein